MNYLDMSTVSERRLTDLPNGSRTREYGNRLATHHMLRIGTRWHRVYAICWGTGATCYIRSHGAHLYIATGEL